MNAKTILDKLVQLAYSWSMRQPTSKMTGNGKPGELLTYLSLDERKLLEKLSSDDISLEKIDRNHVSYFSGMYPENTTTVHSVSIK